MSQYYQNQSDFTDEVNYTTDESHMIQEQNPSNTYGNERQATEVSAYTNGDESDDGTNIDIEGDHDYFDEEDAFGKDYLHEVGAMNCLWTPSAPGGISDATSRIINWLALNHEQIFSGVTVGVTQIPEVCSSALMIGVDPIRALQATWIMNVLTAIIGGRPGMVSGTTGFVALALAKVIETHGVEYMFYSVMFGGICQFVFGLMGLGALMRLLPNPVTVGFVNGMGFLIALQQFRYAKVWAETGARRSRELIQVGHSWAHFTDSDSEWIAAGNFMTFVITSLVCFLTCLLLPKATKKIPSTFVALIVGAIGEWAIARQIGYASPVLNEYADITSGLPTFIWSDHNLNIPILSWDTFEKTYLSGIAVFGVGIMESLLTTQVLNDRIGNRSIKNRVAVSQGIGNLVASIFGGMGGAGMISQSIVANNAYGITGLSTFLSGATVAIIMVAAYPIVKFIPLASFTGIMFYICFCNLIEWSSMLNGVAAVLPESVRDVIQLDYKIPRTDVLVMFCVTTFILVLDLTIAVLTGVLVSVFIYAWDSSNSVVVDRELSEDGMNVTYKIYGPLFFATAQSFLDTFPAEEIKHDPEDVILLLEGAQIFDSSGMVALKKLHDRFEALGKVAALSSLSPISRRIMEKSASMWEGVSFLEVEEIDESEMESIPINIGPHNTTPDI